MFLLISGSCSEIFSTQRTLQSDEAVIGLSQGKEEILGQ